ncbi:MAG: C40 family peptidase, partial [Blautia producta]
LRSCCAYVPPEQAKPGDLIFFQGTYDTPGASHVGIYVGNQVMIHCGDPIQYANISTPYWQQHFMAFGRLP